MRSRLPALLMIGAFLCGCSSSKPPTLTPVPVTATSTRTRTFTPTRRPSPTLTPVPTLSPDDAYARVTEFLTNGSNCRLPCWLGIAPGQSSLLDVRAQLTRFSNITSDSYLDYPADEWQVSGMEILYNEDDMVIEIRSGYLVHQGENNVYVNAFDTRAYRLKDGKYNGDAYGYPSYDELLEAYALFGVLSTHGPPTLVFITLELTTDYAPGRWGFAKLHVGYPEQGIFVQYKMQVDGSGNTYRFCPAESFISGTLIPPGFGTGYRDVLEDLGGELQVFTVDSPFIKTPEEAFGMTIEEFYQFFRLPTGRCLETSKSGWGFGE
jgi:hypothetical protein